MTDPNAPEGEKRRYRRHRVLKSARIIFNHASSTISCVVRDETEVGARLKVDSIVGIPDEFSLQIMAEPARSCKIIWRARQELGVAYL